RRKRHGRTSADPWLIYPKPYQRWRVEPARQHCSGLPRLLHNGEPTHRRAGSTEARMSRRRQIYEGKAKVLFEGPEPGTLVQYFKDDASAFNNQKRGTITGKGVLNNRISEFLMTRLA